MKKIKKAIFPVAGLGTRFLPATKVIPKEMLIVLDKPIIEWAVREAFEAGIEQMIFVNSSKKNIITEHFDRSLLLENSLIKKGKMNEIKIVKEQTQLGEIINVMQTEPKGLGHAIWCARHLINDEKFVVILPDDLIYSKVSVTKQMLKLEDKIGGSILSVEKVPKKDTKKYGILEIDKKFNDHFTIKSIVEKPDPSKAPSNLSVIGRYILDYKIFQFLDKQKIGVGGEIQLTDAIEYLIKKDKVSGFEFMGKRFDCGNKLGYVKANIEFALKDKELKTDLINFIKKL